MQRMQGFAQSQPLFMHLIALHRLRGVASSQSLLLQLGRCWLPGPPSAHDHRPPSFLVGLRDSDRRRSLGLLGMGSRSENGQLPASDSPTGSRTQARVSGKVSRTTGPA